MKKLLYLLSHLLLSICIISCDREYNFLGENTEAVSTVKIGNILKNSASVEASLNTNNNSVIIERGVCYSLTSSPTTSDSSVKDLMDNNTIGNYQINLDNLKAGTKYFVRAYAKNTKGTAYGKELNFLTLPPTSSSVTTTNASNITRTTAQSGGSISDNGGAPITEKGIVYSSNVTTPTMSDTKIISGSGNGNFTSNMIGLSAGTKYYVRAYAVTVAGISYGSVVSFNTLNAALPSGVSTNSIINITANSGLFSGAVTTDGGAAIISRGFVYSNSTNVPVLGTSTSVISGNGLGNFETIVSGLQPNRTYYVRSYATNSAGTAYGNSRSFTTLNQLSIGQPYNGGVIAYIFLPGETGYISGQVHGLIIPVGSSLNYQWGCSGTNISTSTSLGSGTMNTNNIVSGCTAASTAARYAYNLTSGGYSDWFLPSYSELLKIADSGSLLNLSNSYYWTSSQSNNTNAYAVNARNGSSSIYSKTSLLSTLPVRQF